MENHYQSIARARMECTKTRRESQSQRERERERDFQVRMHEISQYYERGVDGTIIVSIQRRTTSPSSGRIFFWRLNIGLAQTMNMVACQKPEGFSIKRFAA
jgi:hypothetical protein